MTCMNFFNSHENSSGYYRVSSYYVSKLLSDLLPLRVVPIPVFSMIAYWMIGMWSLNCIIILQELASYDV